MAPSKFTYDLPSDAPHPVLREAGGPKQFFLSDKKWIEPMGAKGFAISNSLEFEGIGRRSTRNSPL